MLGYKRYAFPTYVKTIIRGDASSGIGLKLTSKKDVHNGQTMVFAVEPRGPAERAGVRRGHVIIEVNGHCTLGATHDHIVELMRKGSTSASLRLRVCPSEKFILPPKRDPLSNEKRASPRYTPTYSKVNKNTPNGSHQRPLSRRLEYDQYNSFIDLDELPDDDSDMMTDSQDEEHSQYPPFQSTPSKSSVPSAGNLRLDQLRRDMNNGSTDLTYHLNSLLAVFKHLMEHGGLTASGHLLYSTVGLNVLLEHAAPNFRNFKIIVSPNATLDGSTNTSVSSLPPFHNRASADSQAISQPKQQLLDANTHSRRLNISRTSDDGYSRGRASPTVINNKPFSPSSLSSNHIKPTQDISTSNTRPMTINGRIPAWSKQVMNATNNAAKTRKPSTKKIASLAAPKWPIDGRRAKLPKDEKKKPTRNDEMNMNQWHFVDLDRAGDISYDEDMRADGIKVISHNSEGVWKAYL